MLPALIQRLCSHQSGFLMLSNNPISGHEQVDDDVTRKCNKCMRTLEESTDTVLAITAPHPSSNAFFITA